MKGSFLKTFRAVQRYKELLNLVLFECGNLYKPVLGGEYIGGGLSGW